MKKSTTFGIVGALLLLTFGAAAYAQGNINYQYGMMNNENIGYMQNMHNAMLNGNINIDQMDEMHDAMTQNFDAETKIQMNAIHEQHINSLQNSNTQTGRFGMMNGNQEGFGRNSGCHS